MVHVWRSWVAPPDDARTLDPSDLSLDPSEARRIARFRRPEDGWRFALARDFLRRILGTYLDVAPAEVPIVIGPRGKPELAPGAGAPEVRFSLAHSGRLALCAVATGRPVGVDVEKVQPIPELDAMIRRCTTPEESDTLAGMSNPERIQAFFKLWTRKEAYLKGLGVGLSVDLAQVSVRDPQRPRLLRDPLEATLAGEAEWSVQDLVPAPDYLGAVALEGNLEAVQRFMDQG